MTVVNTLRCPTLNSSQLQEIENITCTHITRHFLEKFLESTLGGYIRFGTVSSYRPADTAQIGRFSDTQEGRQREHLRNRFDVYDDIEIGESVISGASIEGGITIEHRVNDFCSCSSKGNFNLERAQLLRERGNPDIGAYVVYDLSKLRAAIEAILHEGRISNVAKLVGREVIYGDKDRHWSVVNGFTYSRERDSLKTWLDTVFVKSRDYKHEEEVRLVLINPARIGNLPESEGAWEMTDRLIADAIVASGTF